MGHILMGWSYLDGLATRESEREAERTCSV